MMNLRSWAKIAMAVFLGMCLIPSLGMFVLPRETPAANQMLAPSPSLYTADGALNEAFLQECKNYAGDHFALRQRMITLYAALTASVFRVSAEESVLLGQEDWLYYRETLPGYLRTETMSDRELYAAAHNLALMDEYVRSKGGRLIFTVAPNKISLYPAHLHAVGKPLDGSGDIDRLIPLLKREGVDYIDLFEAFRNAEETLYYHGDSHWNERGAALAHDTLLKGMDQKGRIFFTEEWQTAGEHRGDLYEMLYPTGRKTEPELAPADGFTFSYLRPIRSAEDQRIETASETGTGNLLMFRDSFGNSLYRYLAEDFATAMFSRATSYRLDLVGEPGTCVLIELVERNLRYLTRYAAVFPAPERQLGDEEAVIGRQASWFRKSADESLPGYVRLEGALKRSATDTAIYVRLGQAVYEASMSGEQTGEGAFTLYVPAQSVSAQAEVLYDHGGMLCSAGVFGLS